MTAAEFRVSVGIPVYNAAAFVREAVESALAQPETAEVILVEDYSSDGSWEVCQQLAGEYPRVRLVRPADGKNHGCSAARNLGLRASTCEYVAFLDADDVYLSKRFETARKMLLEDASLDGVYGAIGMMVEDEASLERWKQAKRLTNVLHTMTERIPPQELFEKLVAGRSGSFSTNGLVLRKAALEKSGFLDERLHLHGDEIFFIKLAATARLAPGELDVPVARWRVHDHNRISAPRPAREVYLLHLRFWYILWEWSKGQVSAEKQNQLLMALLNDARLRSRFRRPWRRGLVGVQQRLQLGLLPLQIPVVLGQAAYWRLFKIRSWKRRRPDPTASGRKES